MIHLAADCLPLVRDLGWARSDDPYTHPDRLLDYDVFLYVLSGTMRVSEPGQAYTVKSGEHLFLKKGVPHHGWGTPEGGVVWYWVHFYAMPHPSDAYNDRLPTPEAGHFLPEHYRYRYMLPKQGTSALHPEIPQRLDPLITRFHNDKGLYGRSAISMEIARLFLNLHEQTQLLTETVGSSDGKRGFLANRVIRYLTEHADRAFDASALAQYMGMNYNYIATAFRQQTGQTPLAVHAKLRIQQAIDLMQHTNLNITEISERLQFGNPYYFSRVFKKVTGEPPSSYWRHLYK